MSTRLLILFILFQLLLAASLPEIRAGQGTVLGVWYPAGSSEYVGLPVGTTFRLTINVTSVPIFVSYRIVLIYNTLYLDVLSATTEGTWACPPGNSICETEKVDINDPQGIVDVERFYLEPHGAGSGTLIFIDLQVTGVGATLLSLEDEGIVDTNFNRIPTTIRDGQFNNSGFTLPIADFTFRSLDSTHEAEGRIVQGDIVEFNASLSYDPDGGNITKYRWNFQDGSVDALVETIDPVVTHLFRSRFRAGTGETPLFGNFTVLLSVIDDDGQARSIGHIVEVERLLVHDLRVGVSVRTVAFEGDLVKISASVTNQGNFAEKFQLEVSVESSLIGAINLSLGASASLARNFDWNTTGLSPRVYQIRATVSVVLNETETLNNQQIAYILLSPYPGDIAVLDASTSATFVVQGQNVRISAEVENQGNITESFVVTAYFNGTGIGLEGVQNLPPGASLHIEFRWDTRDVQPGIYNVTIATAPVTGETDFSDNIGVGGIVTVRAESPPYFSPIGSKTISGGPRLSFEITAHDDDGDMLTFSLESISGSPYPEGATITPEGIFSWIPSESQGPGTYIVRVVVTDGVLAEFEDIAITITEPSKVASFPDVLDVVPWAFLAVLVATASFVVFQTRRGKQTGVQPSPQDAGNSNEVSPLSLGRVLRLSP